MKTAKYLLTAFLFLYTAFILGGCKLKDNSLEPHGTPPPAPTGVYSINGDNRVDIGWDISPDRDVAGYNVYISSDNVHFNQRIGSTKDNYFIDYGAKNGVTTYYAVTAYDFDGNESDKSKENVYSTPRPEGFDQIIYDYRQFPNASGYSFANYQVYPYQDKNTDVFFENYQGTFYLDVWNDTDIQDMGKTKDIYDIQTAPTAGWSTTKDAPAIIGHTYVIWTIEGNYAKLRITNITNERVVFDWAYQTVSGNRQLKTAKGFAERKAHTLDELKSRGR